jgi:hypothetical protein
MNICKSTLDNKWISRLCNGSLSLRFQIMLLPVNIVCNIIVGSQCELHIYLVASQKSYFVLGYVYVCNMFTDNCDWKANDRF